MAGILLLGSTSSQYEGFVATRARMAFDIDSTNRQIMCRSAHIATENLTSIKLAFQNFAPGLPENGNGSSATQTAAIEYPPGTINAVVKFGGSTSGTIANGSILFSDYTSLSIIPAGATFWVRKYLTSTVGFYYNHQYQSSTLGESTSVAVSGLTDQTQTTGAITGGTSQTWTQAPVAIIGHTTNPSVLIIGDSRTSGQGDSGESNNFDAKVGNIARSMGSVPFVNIGTSSKQANGWAGNAVATSALLPYGSQVIVALGINDLIAGRNQSQVAADIATILASASAIKKYPITIEPDTSDGGSPSAAWTTTGQQSNLVANRVAYNTLVRAGILAATGFYEVADVVESARNSTFWIVTPSPPYTGDGLHESGAGYALIAASGAIVPASYP